jgi:CDP-diacylglycerol--glycerol-3-phosphate 3-phosphatidyltransferase
MALLGLFIFKWTEIEPHAWILYIFLGVFILSYIIAFARFRKIPGLHLYSVVSSGYAQSTFFFILFVFGFYSWMFYLVVIWGIVAYTEKIFVLLKLDDIKIGVKGLYWVIKNKS